jgi:DNA invertase Pin-like site-specific DNA recombinase
MTKQTRIFGIVRVSEKGAREEANFHSPHIQLDRIKDDVEREGGELVGHREEIDVSGHKVPLKKRHGLLEAVEAVEAGDVDVIVVAYFDRLVRNLSIQREIVQRVEARGGRVKSLDFGEISEATSSQWLQGTMLGMMAEYQARQTAEKTGAAQKRAISEGKQIGRVPFGYERNGDGKLHVSPEGPIVTEAFRKAAFGMDAAAVYLREQAPGNKWTTTAVRRLLTRRTYLGEVSFGEQITKGAHEPLVTLREFETAQPTATKLRRRSGLFPLSGVASCASCGQPMVGTCSGQRRAYGCNREHCPGPPSIQAHVLESYCRDVLAANWDEVFSAGTTPDTQKLQATMEQDELEVEEFAADATAKRLLGDQYYPALETRVQTRERSRAAFRAASKEAAWAEPISADGLTKDASPDELGRLLAAAFRLIEVRRGHLPVDERVTLKAYGSDEPVTMPEDVQSHALKAG